MVEILTQPGHLPSKDWLALVKTSRARNKIKHVINATERAKAIEIGAEVPRKGGAAARGAARARSPRADLEAVAGEYGYSKIEDLHAALGYGKFSAAAGPAETGSRTRCSRNRSRSRVRPSRRSRRAPGRRRHGDLVIKVRASTTCWCTAPSAATRSAGEQIVGYVTRGKGVAVHSACPNVQNLLYEAERRSMSSGRAAAAEPFAVRMIVYTDDRPGMLNQFTSCCSASRATSGLWRRGADEKRATTAPWSK